MVVKGGAKKARRAGQCGMQLTGTCGVVASEKCAHAGSSPWERLLCRAAQPFPFSVGQPRPANDAQ